MESIKPCPFCGGTIELRVTDDCGNWRPEEYEFDADAKKRQDIYFQIVHHENAAGNCPIWCYADEGFTQLYESREDAINAWNRRVNNG